MRRAARIDENQTRIVAALRAVGASVTSLAAVGKGCPDLLIGYRGVNYLLEIKIPRGKLTIAQVVWHEQWAGRAGIARDPREALEFIGAIKPSKTGD